MADKPKDAGKFTMASPCECGGYGGPESHAKRCPHSKVEGKAGNAAPPNAGKGRRKGVPNKVTGELKAMILEALDTAGGAAYLVKQAKKKNPAAFMALLGKVLPMTVSGDPDAPLNITFTWQK